jgi:hypothetical protein
MESYSVVLDGRAINYTVSTYGCDYCGFTDKDKSFFYLVKGGLYCSLHTNEA